MENLIAKKIMVKSIKKLSLASFLLISQTLIEFAQASEDKPTSSVTYSLSVEDNQNFYEESDYSKTHSTDFTFSPKYTTTYYTYVLETSLSYQNNLQHDTTTGNTSISIGRNAFDSFLGSPWKPSYGSNFVIPTDTELRKTAHYKGAIGIRGSLNRSISVLSMPLELLYSLSGSKSFHEFDLNNEGKPLTEYSLKNRFKFDLSITQKFSLGLRFDYINGLTYRRFAREKFESNVEAGYQFNDNLSASLGIATDGSAKKANEFDSNISFFNDNTSTVHSGVTLLF